MADSTAALLAKIKQKKAQYSRNNAKTVKFKEGKTRIRLFLAPNMVNDDHPFGERDLGVHWIKPSKTSKPVAVLGCPEIVYGKPSVINAALEKAALAAVDDETLSVIKDMKARKSVLVNAIIRDGADASEDPQILEMTPTTFGNILSILESYIEDGRTDVLDPKTGVDLIVQRTGKGLDTEYTVMVAPSSKPINPAVVTKANDLDTFIAAEYFRGEEPKALNAIAAMVGAPVAGLAPVRSTAALTSAKPVEEVIEHTETRAASPTRAAAPKSDEPSPSEDFGADLDADELDKMLSDLDGL